MAPATGDAESLSSAVRKGVVTVEVGPERAEYYIHSALLVEHSEYFKKALNEPWKEAEDRVVCLDDVECSTFDAFVDWLYTGKFPVPLFDWVRSCAHYEIAMLKACTFGLRILSSGFSRFLAYTLVDYLVDYRNMHHIATIYAFEHLPTSSPVLRAIIDSHCKYYNEDDDKDNEEEWRLCRRLPNDFLVAVMIRYSKKRQGKKVVLDKCNYHGHATQEERVTCQWKVRKPWSN